MTPGQSIGVAVYLALIFSTGYVNIQSNDGVEGVHSGVYRYFIGVFTGANVLTMMYALSGPFSPPISTDQTVRATLAHVLLRQTVVYVIGANHPDPLAAKWSVLLVCPLYYYGMMLLRPRGFLAVWMFACSTATKLCAFRFVWGDAVLDAAVDAGACALLLFADWNMQQLGAPGAKKRGTRSARNESDEEPADDVWWTPMRDVVMARTRTEQNKQDANAIFQT
jgi:hypothetical protein